MNKPYCWLLNGEVWFKEPKETDKEFDGYEITPLYTHPVKELDEPNWKEMYWEMHELNHKHWSELKDHTKKLTDEEIIELCKSIGVIEIKALDNYPYHFSKSEVLNFARAILRKAQET